MPDTASRLALTTEKPILSAARRLRTPSKILLPPFAEAIATRIETAANPSILPLEIKYTKDSLRMLASSESQVPTITTTGRELNTLNAFSKPRPITPENKHTETTPRKFATLGLTEAIEIATNDLPSISKSHSELGKPDLRSNSLTSRKLLSPVLLKSRNAQTASLILGTSVKPPTTTSRNRPNTKATGDLLPVHERMDSVMESSSNDSGTHSKLPSLIPAKELMTTKTPQSQQEDITGIMDFKDLRSPSRLPRPGPKIEPKAISSVKLLTPDRKENRGRAVRASPNALNRLNEQDPAFQRALEAFGLEKCPSNTKERGASNPSSSQPRSMLPVRANTKVDETKAISGTIKEDSDTSYTNLFKRLTRRG